MLGAPLRNAIFAGNRAVGRIAFTVAAGLGGSRRGRVHESGSLRVRFPNGNSKTALEAVIVNTGGGMTGRAVLAPAAPAIVVALAVDAAPLAAAPVFRGPMSVAI